MTLPTAKQYYYRVCFLIILAFGYSYSSLGQEYLDTLAQDTVKAKKFSLDKLPVLPVLYYTPETRLAFGLMTMQVFRVDPNDTLRVVLRETLRKKLKPWQHIFLSRTSNLKLVGVYTANKQVLLESVYNLFFPKEKYIFSGLTYYYKFPEYNFGVGNNSADTEKRLIQYRYIRSENRLLRKIIPHFWGGVQHQVLHMFEVDNTLRNLPITGNKGGINSGAGIVLVYDSRDNVVYPYKGSYVEFSNAVYTKWLLSEYNFKNYRLDIRKYFSLRPDHILAFQALLNINAGDPSFKKMSELGGMNLMRGYYMGRFRDKHMAVLQAEYRAHIWKRLGTAVFASAGQVGKKPSDFGIGQLHYTAGGGIRFAVNQPERINLRLDYGYGIDEGSHGVYVTITEAF